ncbi:hypothetical protein A2165_01340 [Candidatus Curtissbacteria bacterium RBG_13_40_7]|uniref:Class I SAM-dependent methyltransferase n=1 Tax=Candidatus Curtissbacteria bacterium RBG_13_40_7 TaxID=1797706 RepID=A0A1F5FWS7_9BACT|nr:MAG: hypothetical protein A2165_01340 [Candidatus Curtissbacteria bacterium RBG_13_40_7]
MSEEIKNKVIEMLGDRIPARAGEEEWLEHYLEYWQLFLEAQKVSAIEGDFAELGVARGESARMICEGKGDKLLHLFDTFEGLPEPEKIEKTRFNFFKGKYKGDFDEVRKYLKNYERVIFYKGFFPDSAESAKEIMFSFVHLDADLRKTTEEGLKFFYPRLVTNGIIIAHDFRARFIGSVFEEFFKDKPEKIEFLFDGQCIVRKK